MMGPYPTFAWSHFGSKNDSDPNIEPDSKGSTSPMPRSKMLACLGLERRSPRQHRHKMGSVPFFGMVPFWIQVWERSKVWTGPSPKRLLVYARFHKPSMSGSG